MSVRCAEPRRIRRFVDITYIRRENINLISLKKYLDMEPDKPRGPEPAKNDLFLAVLESYRAVLLAMGNNGVRACPAVGSDLQGALTGLERRLFAQLTVPLVRDTEAEVEAQLRQWGGCAAEYFQTKADEVKELLIVLASTAESMGRRDQAHENHFGQITAQLRTMADFDDLTLLRKSLVKQATELKTYVEKMAQESHESLAKLRAEVGTYEGKLKVVEQLASQDSLTGMANRRNIEERIESCIAQKQIFCVLILDLDHFKEVNDTYGHPAGDSLLKRFADELRANMRSSDRVGRWGGDEFLVVLECDLEAAQSQIERLQKWVFGEYTIPIGEGQAEAKVTVDASIGLAQWQPGETIKELIRRADSTMYRMKQQGRGHNA